MQAHTWEDPDLNQIQTQRQAKRDGQRKCGRNARVSEQTATRALLFLLGLPVCVCSHELFSPLRNTLPFSLLSISLWKFIFYKATQARVLSLVWRLGFGTVTATAWLQSWPGTEVLFQVAAGRGHLRSRPIRNLWYFRWGLVIQLGASYRIMRRVWGDDQTTRFQGNI